MTTSMPEQGIVRAAGGLLWRQCQTRREIAIVRRVRGEAAYALPKGKLKEGESWQSAALREMREETGYDAIILGYAGALSYEVEGEPKVVQFWHMQANDNPRYKIDTTEIDEVIWLPVEAAIQRLKYPLERAMLESSLLQHPFSPPKEHKRRWVNFFRPVSLKRLTNALDSANADLDAVIEQAGISVAVPVAGWDQRSKQLIVLAKQASDDGDAELGWRRLKSADRCMLYGLNSEQLKIEASPILAEANDEEKGLSKWRRASIQGLLADEGGKLKGNLSAQNLVRAKRIIDEHHDNVYQKMEILKWRLLMLSLISVIAVVAWVLYPPFPPFPSSRAILETRSAALLWSGIMLSGVLGAIFSGFSYSVSANQKGTRIPAELATSTLTFARLSMAVIASLAISILLVSGILDIPQLHYEMMLAVAFVSGFSDRLLLRGVQSLSK